jgi:hypothetical protein
LFGFGEIRPVDYSLSPQVSFFAPLPKYRGALGGSVTVLRNGIQSFSVRNINLPGPPFPTDAKDSRATFGRVADNFFSASFVFARRLGADGRTSIGFGADFLSQSGSLLNLTTPSGSGLTERERLESRSNVRRARFTVGLTRDIGSSSKLGIFYRYSHTSANDRNRLHTLDGVPLPLEQTAGKENSSEIGARFRGSITRRLFYGVEGDLLIGTGDESIRHSAIIDSNERARAARASLGFGIGYAPRSHTVFSFDVTGGLVRNRSMLYENATGNLLESERKRICFLSLHAAVQADIWRRSFVSGSVLSLTQSQTTDFARISERFGQLLTTDGVLLQDVRIRNRFTNYSSNVGVGWRFTPNFLAQYIFSTDFGLTSPRHTLLLRYTFNVGKK